MTRTRWKKKGRSKHSDAKTLALLIVISFAAHVAFILFVPSFAIFPPLSDYIEVDVIDIGSPIAEEDRGESVEGADFSPPRIPEENPPVIDTGLGALEWEALAPQTPAKLEEFARQTRPQSESAAPEAIPRAENLLTQEHPEKEQPDVAERELTGASLIDDAVTAVEIPPRQVEKETADVPAEPALTAPAETASFARQEPTLFVSAIPQSRRTLSSEPLNAERETWSRPELEKEDMPPVRFPATKSVPDFEQQETFHVDVPSVERAQSSESAQIAIEEEMPPLEHAALPVPAIAIPNPIITERREQAAFPMLPERERPAARVVRPGMQAESSQDKAIPVEQAPERLPMPTVVRTVPATPAADNADELLPPPVMTRPHISEDGKHAASIREFAAAQRPQPTVQEHQPVPPRVLLDHHERTMPMTPDVPESALTKTLPQPVDDIAQVAREEETPPEETIQIEGPASARQVVYRPSRLPSVTLDRDVTIRLKFWVLPDGAVGDVVPLQRGDVRLEQAAIQYVKSWRFTPISSGETVWGIIPVKYRLK